MKYTWGTSSADFLQGVLHELNEMHGLEDSDVVFGGYKADVLTGDQGDDLIWGDGGDDNIDGGEGFDVLYGAEGNDTINGGADNDYISGGKGNDVVDAGSGDDVVNGNSGDDFIRGGDGNDYLFGTDGNDTLEGGEGDDYLAGGSDNDVLIASNGNDTYIGGSGFDTLDLSGVGAYVNVDLNKNVMTFDANGQSYYSTLDGIERVVAGDAGMHALGDRGANVFVGGKGDDWMRGKGGADILTGGAGHDTFAYLKKDLGSGLDHITDFNIAEDSLFLDGFDPAALRVKDAFGKGVTVQHFDGKIWADVVTLDGLNIKSVGDDHHAMTIADLNILV